LVIFQQVKVLLSCDSKTKRGFIEHPKLTYSAVYTQSRNLKLFKMSKNMIFLH